MSTSTVVEILAPEMLDVPPDPMLWRLAALGVDATVRHSSDYPTVAAHGAISPPALAIGERVLLAGRVPSVAQLTDLLSVHTGQSPDGSTGSRT